MPDLIETLYEEWSLKQEYVNDYNKYCKQETRILEAKNHFIKNSEDNEILTAMRQSMEEHGFMQGLKCAFALFKELQE